MADDLQLLINVKSNADEATRGLDRLQGSVAKNAKAIELLQKDYKVLDRAFNKNNLTAQQYAKGVQQVDAAIEQLHASNNAMVSSTERVTKSLEKANVAQQKFENTSRKGMRRVELVAQQAGYQIGDLAVQIQGGTNAAVALGQQGSQLLGFFGPAGALAGAGLAIATAFIAPFIKAKEKAEDFYDLLEERAVKLELLKKGIESEEAGQAQEALLAAREELERYRKNAESIEELTDLQVQKLQSQEALVAKLEDELQYYADLQQAIEVAGNLAADLTAAGDERINNAQEELDLQANMENLVRLFYNYRLSEEEKLTAAQKANYDKAESSLSTQLALVQAEISLRQNYTDEQYIQNRLEQIKVDLMAEQNGLTVNQRNKLVELIAQLQTEKELLDDINKAEVRRLAIIEARKSSGQREPTFDPRDPSYVGAEKARLQRLKDMIESGELYNSTLDKTTKKTKANTGATKDNRTAYEKAMMTATEFADALDRQVIGAVDGVANAFSDFLAGGLKDFKSFVGSIKDMFIRLLADMAAMALQRKILIPIAAGFAGGFGSAAAGATTANLIAGGGIGGTLALGASSLGMGASAALGIGGYASAGMFNVGANAAVATAAGASPMMATIGAAIPPLIAVAAVIGLFTKKTKELDNGLKVTVDGMESLVETFRVTQSSRLFGLLKGSKKTSMTEMTEGPLVDAIKMMQQSVVGLAQTLGFGAESFNNFSYDFKLSLKGMTEEEQLQALQEELLKMADSMAELVPLVGSFNELAAVAQERVALENQLLQAEGDIVELRKRELATVHILNQELAARLHVLQAEADMQGALGAFAAGIAEQQGLIRRAVDALVKPLQDAIDRTKSEAQKSYAIFREAADKARSEAQTLVDIIRGAISGRTIRSEAAERMRYTVAQQQLAGFAAGGAFDEASLRRAVEGVSIDSSKFFGSFEDYARDFYKTQISLSELEAKASEELSEVEQQIEVAEKQYEVSMGTYQEVVDLNTAIKNLATDLNIYDATLTANQPLLETITSTGETQIETLDAVLVEVTKQVNSLLGIENSLADLVGGNVSIGEALGVLGIEAEGLNGGVLAIDAVVTDLQGNVSDLGLYVVDLNGTALKLDTSVFSLGGTVVDLDGTVTDLFGGINLLDGTVDGLGTKVDELGVHTDDLGIDINNLGTTLSEAMGGLGSTVTSLTGAIGQLAASQNALAAAQQAQAAAAANAQQAIANKSITELEAQAANINVPEEIKIVSTTARGKGGGFFGLFQSDKSSYVTVSGDASEFGATGSGTQFHSKQGGTSEEVAHATSMAEAAIAKRNEQIATANASLDELRNQIIELGGTPTFAMGGMHSGGLRLVGERGPELEVTGPSRIYNKRDTMEMLSGASSETASEIRMLRREVSELRAEQRKIGVENVKYNKKTYDLNREWDVVGLPATRTAS